MPEGASSAGAAVSILFTLAYLIDGIICAFKGKPLIVGNKVKKENSLISVAFNCLFGIIPLLLNLFTLNICGYSDNPLANLGIGAILSGIFALISCIFYCLAVYYSINNIE